MRHALRGEPHQPVPGVRGNGEHPLQVALVHAGHLADDQASALQPLGHRVDGIAGYLAHRQQPPAHVGLGEALPELGRVAVKGAEHIAQKPLLARAAQPHQRLGDAGGQHDEQLQRPLVIDRQPRHGGWAVLFHHGAQHLGLGERTLQPHGALEQPVGHQPVVEPEEGLQPAVDHGFGHLRPRLHPRRRGRRLPLRAAEVGSLVDGEQRPLGTGLRGPLLDQIPPGGGDQKAQGKTGASRHREGALGHGVAHFAIEVMRREPRHIAGYLQAGQPIAPLGDEVERLGGRADHLLQQPVKGHAPFRNPPQPGHVMLGEGEDEADLHLGGQHRQQDGLHIAPAQLERIGHRQMDAFQVDRLAGEIGQRGADRRQHGLGEKAEVGVDIHPPGGGSGRGNTGWGGDSSHRLQAILNRAFISRRFALGCQPPGRISMGPVPPPASRAIHYLCVFPWCKRDELMASK